MFDLGKFRRSVEIHGCGSRMMDAESFDPSTMDIHTKTSDGKSKLRISGYFPIMHLFRSLIQPWLEGGLPIMYLFRSFIQPWLEGEYTYDKLPNDSCIRTVHIHPGSPDEDVKVSLECVRFDDKTPPCYEALSYVWGSTEHPDYIQVVTEGSRTARLKVSHNLAVALRNLRHLDKGRTMWIDAICINQKNDEEKGPQVAQMGAIYSKASRVTVWLGPEREGSDAAMGFMKTTGSYVNVDWHTDQMTSAPDAPDPNISDRTIVIQTLRDEQWRPVFELLTRPWFDRLWIRQEVHLATSALVKCGQAEVPWPLFRNALYCISMKGRMISGENPLSKQLNMRLGTLAELHHHSHVSAHEMRSRFENVQCFDPRDRVFAVRSMVSPACLSFWPAPDYTKSRIEIYKELMFGHLKTYSDGLHLLSHCEYHGQPSPTWVPDWSVKASPRRMWQGGGCRLGDWWEVPSWRGTVLRVLGKRIDVVQTMTEVPNWLSLENSATKPCEAIHAYRRVLPNIHEDDAYAHGGTLLEAYALTLANGHVAERRSNKTGGWVPTEAIVDIVQKLLHGHKFDHPKDMWSTANLFRTINTIAKVTDKKLFKAAGGTIGLGPPPVEVGDEIWAIVGCSMPMVLRETDNGKYIVVSECYAKGFVDAEGILGPLPPGIRGTWSPDDKGRWGIGFEEVSTGRTFSRDPRLEALGLLEGKSEEVINNRAISFKYGTEEPGTERLTKVIPDLKKIELV